MADSSDAKPIEAAGGPEMLDLTTLQGLPPAAIVRLQRLRAEQEAQLRKRFRDVPPMGAYCAPNPYNGICADHGEYWANHLLGMATPIARASYKLFVAVGQEYAQAVVNPQQLGLYLDEAQERVTNYARNRLIEIVTGKPIGKCTNLPTPSRNELKNSYLWDECNNISAKMDIDATRAANDLKVDAWEKHTAALQLAAGSSETVPTDPVDAMPEPIRSSNAKYPNRAAWLEAKMAEDLLSIDRIKKLGGPDPTTTKKILRGETVRPLQLIKLAKALGVQRDTIPND